MKPDGAPELLVRRKAKGEWSMLVIDPREAEIVREIFEAYAVRGLGISTIANLLNAPPRRRIDG